MPFYFFIWDDEDGAIIDKLAHRGITPEDVEHVVEHPWRKTTSRSSGLPLYEGETPDGRDLAVIFRWVDQDTIQVISAYRIDDE